MSIRRGEYNYCELNLPQLWFSCQGQNQVKIIISQLLQPGTVYSDIIPEHLGQNGDISQSPCQSAEMSSNPVEVWKNRQDHTTMILNNWRIRGPDWPTGEQAMFLTGSPLHTKCPTITHCLSPIHLPGDSPNFTLPRNL